LTADDNRTASKLRAIPLLDRRIERVHVNVQNPSVAQEDQRSKVKGRRSKVKG
jgi:hypothetical protein